MGDDWLRHPAKRRRVRSVLQEIKCRATQFIRKARQRVLDFGGHCPAFKAFVQVSGTPTGSGAVAVNALLSVANTDSPMDGPLPPRIGMPKLQKTHAKPRQNGVVETKAAAKRSLFSSLGSKRPKNGGLKIDIGA
jgi:hypothetical protein